MHVTSRTEATILPSAVLVALDGSTFAERAIAPAEDLALRFGAELRLVGATIGPEPGPFEEQLAERARRSVVGDAGWQVLRHQFPGPGLAALADERPASVIVMSTHMRGAVGQLAIGSVAEEIVRLGRTPVVLLGPSYDGARELDGATPGRIVLCDDCSLAPARLAPLVSAWARHLGWEVDVLRVVEDSADDGGCEPEELADLLRSGGLTVTVSHVIGSNDSATQIVDHAIERGATVIAMGSHGGAARAFNVLGSTVGDVVRTSPIPVLVRRP